MGLKNKALTVELDWKAQVALGKCTNLEISGFYLWISPKQVATNTERWKEANLDFTWVEGVKVRRHIQLLILHYNFYTMLPHLKKKKVHFTEKIDTGTKLVENSQVKVPSWFKRIVSGQDFSSGPARDTLSQKIFYKSWKSIDGL